MTSRSVCKNCGAALPPRPGPGRRPRYCSLACRRAAEYARRRWDRQARRIDRYAHSRDGRSAIIVRLVREAAARLRQAAGPRP
jgi:hypothetical protein